MHSGGLVGTPPLPSATQTTPSNNAAVSNNHPVFTPSMRNNLRPLSTRDRDRDRDRDDDECSDAATVGTSVADTADLDGVDLGDVDAHIGRFESVKRWALRVNNAQPLTINPTLNTASNATVPSTISVLLDATTPTEMISVATPLDDDQFVLDQSALHPHVDPVYLAEFMATLDEHDAEAIGNFLASYRGPDVVAAMHAHLAMIQEVRADEKLLETMPMKPIDWETLPLNIGSLGEKPPNHAEMRGPATHQSSTDRHYTSSTEDGLFSDAVDVVETTEGVRSAESDWIVLDENLVQGTPTLQGLPKRPLTKILLASKNSNILKTCRRLARVPLPTLGHDLADIIFALIPSSASFSSSSSLALPVSLSSSSSNLNSTETEATRITEILTRAARCPYANRSHLTLPCLHRIATSQSGVRSSTPTDVITLETLGAVIDIAAKERRWNTVRGALLIAQTVFGLGAEKRRTAVEMSIEELDVQRLRRPFLKEGGVGGGLYASLVANVVANHGKELGVGFFAELVDDGGVLFSADVVRHCSENYGLSAAVVEYLMRESERLHRCN